MRFALSLLLLLSPLARADATPAPTDARSRCGGQFLSCHDAQTGQTYNFVGADTCVQCSNGGTGEVYWYGICKKDGDSPGNSGSEWWCRER